MASSADAIGEANLGLVKPLVLAGVTVAVIGVATALSQSYICRRRRKGSLSEEPREFKKARIACIVEEARGCVVDHLLFSPPRLSLSTSSKLYSPPRRTPTTEPSSLYGTESVNGWGAAGRDSSDLSSVSLMPDEYRSHAIPSVIPVVDSKTTSLRPPVRSISEVRFGVESVCGMDADEVRCVAFKGLPINADTAFFGIYEGHRGSAVANYLAEVLHNEIDKQLEVVERDDLQLCMGDEEEDEELKMATRREAIGLAFSQVDKHFKEVLLQRPRSEAIAGSTAICILLYHKERKLLVANLGHNRCILGRGKGFVELASNHTPTNPKELSRITKACGTVKEGRIDGVLGVSRAFGDYEYKNKKSVLPEEQVVSNVPDFLEIDAQRGEQFLVIASAGLWEVATNEDVRAFVAERLAKYIGVATSCVRMGGNEKLPNNDEELSVLARELALHAVSLGCTGNLSVCIVLLP